MQKKFCLRLYLSFLLRVIF